jgi:glucose/mannose-6-phosphate isomerase
VSDLEPPYGERDPADMAGRIAAAPRQIEQALERCAADPWTLAGASPDLLAVGALGGSAIAADLAAVLYRDRLPRPLVTVRDTRWPAYLNPRGLALLSSYSGETEETLSLYREAAALGVPRAAITTGGRLEQWCRRDGCPVMMLPAGSPPRAAVYASWVSISQLVHALGWVEDPSATWTEAAGRLRDRDRERGPRAPEADNPAKRLARQLHGAFVLIYAGTSLGPVATRMRNQINENAKLLAHSADVPELDHNEIVGWERRASLPERTAVVLLRDTEDSPEIEARLTWTGEYAARQGARVFEVREDDGGRLARMASLVQFGDYLSLYLGLLNGVDPTPIASIVAMKRDLAQRRGQGG